MFALKKFSVMIGRIKAVLAYSNMTETQFAKRLGVTQSSLNRTMRGATEISFKLVNAILTEFDEISAEWLMRGMVLCLPVTTQQPTTRELKVSLTL